MRDEEGKDMACFEQKCYDKKEKHWNEIHQLCYVPETIFHWENVNPQRKYPTQYFE